MSRRPPLRLLGGGHRAAAEESGMVTAEMAVLLPVLVALTALLVGLLTVAGAQLALAESARAGARELARGGDARAESASLARRWPQARVRLLESGESVTVELVQPVRLPGSIGSLVPLPDLRATATVAREGP